MGFDVIQGDCLEVMRGLPSASIDACITDPPYGTTACSWDSVIPFAPMWAELRRIVKPKGAIVLFGSQPFTSALVMSNPAMFSHEWVWDKKFAGNFVLAGSRPMKTHESISVFCAESPAYYPQMVKRDVPITGGGMSESGTIANGSFVALNRQYEEKYPVSILKYPRDLGNTIHPTQKPVDLLRYLVRTYTNAGDTVLDFTCGSGTTGVACEIEGRNSINIDSDEHYCEVSRARMLRASGIAADIPRRVKAYAPTPLFEAVA